MKDSGEDSDSIDPPSSKNISFPPPLNLVTPEQALEILLLLSRNRNVADYINFDRGPVLPGNDDLLKHTSQSGPELEMGNEPRKESVDSSDTVRTIQTLETDPEQSFTLVRETSVCSDCPPTTIVTDELCQNKFEELKQLLSDARKAVNNIVHTQEKLRQSDASIIESCDSKIENTRREDEKNALEESKGTSAPDDDEEEAVNGSLDVWTTPSVSRSNSDNLGRAGKYRKKPAPRAPLARSEEKLNEDGGGVLKATLVIKTGTLKSFSNASSSKEVFVSKGKRSKRQRTKEGLSKLFTIPRNMFQNAFHRAKEDSDETGSSSIEPPKFSSSSSSSCQERGTNDEKNENDTSNESYVLAPTDDGKGKDKVEDVETDKERMEDVEWQKVGKRLESDIF